MKKQIASYALLLGSIVYLIFELTRSPLYVAEVYLDAKNPISFKWLSIDIDTGVVANAVIVDMSNTITDEAIYSVSLVPVYFMIIISLVLFIMAVKKK
ncbi:hypothetical protein NSQ26_12240 [Bacillus sp. FSL W7-1360]